MSYTVNKVLLAIGLLLWAGVLLRSTIKAFSYSEYVLSDIADDIRTFRIALGFQILTSVYVIIVKQSLAPIINNLKMILEILVVWYFLEPQT